MNEGTIRIGIVNAVNAGALTVRVQFPDTEIMSDWLPVLRRKSAVSGTGETEGHTHSVSLGNWLPSVGDTVLCLYMPGFNADGYVLGGIA